MPRKARATVDETEKTTPATQALMLARVAELVQVLLAGAKTNDVREFVAERSLDATSIWFVRPGGAKLSNRQIANYTRKATAAIAESTRETRKGRIRRHLAQRQHLYAQAVAAGDYKAALAMLDSEAKLLGLRKPAGAAQQTPKPAPGPSIADFTRKRG